MTMRTLKMLEEHNTDVPGCGSYHRGLWILKLLYHYDGPHHNDGPGYGTISLCNRPFS